MKYLLFVDIKAGLFLTLLTLNNLIESSRTHRQRQVSFDVQSFGDLPSHPTMDGHLPEAQVAVSCKFKYFVLQNHVKTGYDVLSELSDQLTLSNFATGCRNLPSDK